MHDYVYFFLKKLLLQGGNRWRRKNGTQIDRRERERETDRIYIFKGAEQVESSFSSMVRGRPLLSCDGERERELLIFFFF